MMQPYANLISSTGFNNPLIVAAMPLLLLLIQLKKSDVHPEPGYLQQQIINELNHFEKRAKAGGCLTLHVLAARYCLTTVIDEFILLRDWGSNSIWVQKSLLSVLHKETWGGERFFIIIERMSKKPRENSVLLEFLYILLSLGFEGKYYNQAKNIREEIRYRLFSLINHIKNPHKKFDLSINSKTLGHKDNKKNHLTGWRLFSLTTMLVVIVGFIFNMLTLLSAKDLFKKFDQINESLLPYKLHSDVSEGMGRKSPRAKCAPPL